MRAVNTPTAPRHGMKPTHKTQTHTFHPTPRHTPHDAVAHCRETIPREFESLCRTNDRFIVERIDRSRVPAAYPTHRGSRARARAHRIHAPAGFFFAAGFFAAGFFFVAVVFFTAGFFAAGFFPAGFFAAGFFAAGFFAGALATMLMGVFVRFVYERTLRCERARTG